MCRFSPLSVTSRSHLSSHVMGEIWGGTRGGGLRKDHSS